MMPLEISTEPTAPYASSRRPSDNSASEITSTHISTISAAANTGTPPHNDLRSSLTAINDLRFFLATAPVNWQENQVIRRYFLNDTLGFVSCICWNKLFYITGTDIVKVCLYLTLNFGREIHHKKKFEEGIFSDLRNLKCGVDAVLEQPKSEFLAFLFKNMCLKTQKKQKVFFWFSVPHEKLFSDALERDLKRETLHQACCTKAVGVPATSFRFDFTSSMPLHEQLNQFFRRLEQSLESEQQQVPKDKESGKLEEEPLDDDDDDDDEYDDPTEQVLPSEHPLHTAMPEIRPQVLVVEKQQHEDAQLPDRETQNRSRRSLLDDNGTSHPGEEDFPLDYFPVSIEYPGQQPQPVAMPQPVALPLPPEFAAQFQQGYGAPLAQAFPAMLSPVPVPVAAPAAEVLQPETDIPEPARMTNRVFYEASRRVVSGGSGSGSGIAAGAFSPLPVHRGDADTDDIQYEVRDTRDTRDTRSAPAPAPAPAPVPLPQNAGVYGNPLYSSFFFPQPYTSASQEFANYDGSGNYFPEDYVPYGGEAPVLPPEALQPQPQAVPAPPPLAQTVALDPARGSSGSTFSRPATSAATPYGHSRASSITAQKRVGKPQRYTPGHQRQFSRDRLAQYVDGRGAGQAPGQSSETSQDDSFGDL